MRDAKPTVVGSGSVVWNGIATALAQAPMAGTVLVLPSSEYRSAPALPGRTRPTEGATGQTQGPPTTTEAAASSSSTAPSTAAPNTAPAVVAKTPTTAAKPQTAVSPAGAAPSQHRPSSPAPATVPKPTTKAPVKPVAEKTAPVTETPPIPKRRRGKKKEEETNAEAAEPVVRAKPSTSKKRKAKEVEDPSKTKKVKSSETVDSDGEDATDGEEGEEMGIPEDTDAPPDISQAWIIRYMHAKHDVLHKAYGTAGDDRCNHCVLRKVEHCWTVRGLKCQACRASKIRCDRETGKTEGEKVPKIPRPGNAQEGRGMLFFTIHFLTQSFVCS